MSGNLSNISKRRRLFDFVLRLYRRLRIVNLVFRIAGRKRAVTFTDHKKRFILFLVPGIDFVNGGIMSIFSIASETRNLVDLNEVSVGICTAYNEPRVMRYTKFENDFDIIAFSDLLTRFPVGSNILIHIPELFLKRYVSDCLRIYHSRSDLKWRFNILLQNIDLIPSGEDIRKIRQLGTITATAAHKAYATRQTAERLGCAVYHLSTWVCPEEFELTDYLTKQNLIVISPDPHSLKSVILDRISQALPDHKIVEIHNMTYQQYRQIIQNAKFTFTFGEGLDGYFVETIFSGGIGMAIFNDRFFTRDYRDLDGVFSDEKHALAIIGEFLHRANNEGEYRSIAKHQFDAVANDYVRDEYRNNLKRFYEATGDLP